MQNRTYLFKAWQPRLPLITRVSSPRAPTRSEHLPRLVFLLSVRCLQRDISTQNFFLKIWDSSPRISNPMENNFSVLCPDREIMKPSVTIFWFRENSWESIFISFHVRNMLLNILLKSVCTIIVKNLQCLLNICQKKVKLFVKCLCMKVSKTPDSSSTQLKKYTHLQCSLQIYCLFIKRFGPHRQFQQWNGHFLRLAYCCNLNLLIIYLLFSCNCYHILQRFQNNRNYPFEPDFWKLNSKRGWLIWGQEFVSTKNAPIMSNMD